MLRDNASNAIKACRDWGISHFGCIGHSLHLIVGPLFVQRHSNSTEVNSETEESILDDECLDDIVDYDEDELLEAIVDTYVLYQENLKNVNKIVERFRKVINYIRRSVNAKAKLESIQRTNGSVGVLSPDIDVRTRWNSTLVMLKKLVHLKMSFCIFFQYLKSPEGRKEFNKTLPTFLDKDWALIEGLCIILEVFLTATEQLSGEKYSTFVLAVPVLRRVKQYLENETLLTKYNGAPEARNFFEKYGEERFLPSVIYTLNIIRQGLLSSFKKRFTGMTIDILWTTILDPKCRSLKHLTATEKELARKKLIDEVVLIATTQSWKYKNRKIPSCSGSRNQQTKNMIDTLDIFDSPVRSVSNVDGHEDEENEVNQHLQIQSAKREVEIYLDLESTVVLSEEQSLSWWRDHKNQFPIIAELARKWLSVTATSTPSERVFSDCGLALTAKRSRMKGNVLQDQIMIRRNTPCVSITEDDIQACFSRKK
jgi:hypothetical protein